MPLCVCEMNQSENVAAEQRAGVEVTKDKNGIEQVVLRSPRGASARVRSFNLDSLFDWLLHFDSFSFRKPFFSLGESKYC